jgi:polar amino acid transport system substrate-binding protein
MPENGGVNVSILRSKTYVQRGFVLARVSAVPLLVVAMVSGGVIASLSGSSYASSKASKTSLHSLVPAKIRATGKLTDLVNSPYDPMEYQAASGGPIVGFDIDIARALAKELGLSLVVTNTPSFSELMPAVETNRTDIVDSSVTDLTSRESVAHFVDDFKSGVQFLGLKSNSKTFTTNADLCGKTVVVQSGTAYATQIAALSKSICATGKSIATLSVTSPPEQNTQVELGRAIALAQGPEINTNLELSQPNKWRVIGKTFDPFTYGIIFNKSDPQLGIALRAALNALIQNGTYKQTLARWHLSGDGVASATIDKGSNAA